MIRFYLVVFFLGTAWSGFAQKVQLRLHLEAGKTYRQHVKTKVQTFIVADDGHMNMDISISGLSSFHVKSINANKEYEMETRFEKMSMTMTMPQGAITFSSESEDTSDPFSMILASIVDQPIQLRMNTLGKITFIDTNTSRWNQAIERYVPEAKRAQVKAQLVKSFGPETIKTQLEQVTDFYPEGSVSVQDTWTKSATHLNQGANMLTTTTYRLDAISPDSIRISGTGTIHPKGSSEYVAGSSGYTQANLSGKNTFQLTMDRKSGWLRSGLLTQELDGNLYVKPTLEATDSSKVFMEMSAETVLSAN
jgi:predicted component of type VI protein secretion system